MALSLLGFALLALKREQAEQAARLLGALDRLTAAGDVVLKPPDCIRYQHAVAAAQSQVDQIRFAEAWANGQGLTLEQALDQVITGQAASTFKRT